MIRELFLLLPLIFYCNRVFDHKIPKVEGIMMESHHSETNLNILSEKNIWGFDSVTQRELGWWLNRTGLNNDRNRMDYVESAIKHLKMDKVYNKTEAMDMLNSTHNVQMYLTLSPNLRDDFEILEMQAKDNKGCCVAESSERLQNDPEMAKIIMKYDTTDINYLNDKMKDNFEVMKVVANQGSDMIREAGPNCLANRSLALISVKNNPNTLIHFSGFIRDDPNIVMTAIEKNRNALRHASPRFSNSYKMWYLPLWVLRNIKIP